MINYQMKFFCIIFIVFVCSCTTKKEHKSPTIPNESNQTYLNNIDATKLDSSFYGNYYNEEFLNQQNQGLRLINVLTKVPFNGDLEKNTEYQFEIELIGYEYATVSNVSSESVSITYNNSTNPNRFTLNTSDKFSFDLAISLDLNSVMITRNWTDSTKTDYIEKIRYGNGISHVDTLYVQK
jgi:hypothetical protein